MQSTLITVVFLLPWCLAAQNPVPVAPPTPAGTPVHVLYRLFFRDIAALDAAADSADANGRPGADNLRNWYGSKLLLTPSELATLKRSARDCNTSLDQHQQKAMPAIAVAKTQNDGANGPRIPPPQLVALEQERTAISVGCIQHLQTAMGSRKFNDIDVFVRSTFAQKISKLPPPNAPFANTPAPTRPVGGAQ